MTFNFYNQWQFRNVNWIDFTIFNLGFEWDKLLGGLELNVGILGLNLGIRHQYTETEALKELREMADDFIETRQEE